MPAVDAVVSTIAADAVRINTAATQTAIRSGYRTQRPRGTTRVYIADAVLATQAPDAVAGNV